MDTNPQPKLAPLDTATVHVGEQRFRAHNSLIVPIVQTAVYTFRDTAALVNYTEEHMFWDEPEREEYGRYGNPGERVVERKLAALEGGEEAVLFSSGMAAIVGLLMSKLNSGDEVIFFDECYHRSREFCTKHLSRFGVVTRQVPTGDYEAMFLTFIAAALISAVLMFANRPLVRAKGSVQCT